MPETSDRTRIPNANSPKLLGRLIDSVARGIRSTRGLQESLAVESRTVRYYAHAGEWLGLLENHGDTWLTPLGLEYAFAGRRRDAVYARAVWSTPFVIELMSNKGTTEPTVDEIATLIAAHHPDMASSTIRRRASSVRSLICPAMNRARPRESTGPQLELPLLPSTPSTSQVHPIRTSDRDYDPEVYRYFLSHLLDYGELTLGHIRALLDCARADKVPIGSLVDMAIKRGDGFRKDDRLLATGGAVLRREVTEATASIILSDQHYRTWLATLIQSSKGDRRAEIERDTTAKHYWPWHRRIFGEIVSQEGIERALHQTLLDRSLDAFPVSGDTCQEPTSCDGPYLDHWQQPGLFVCLPPSLSLLQGGLSTVNRLIRRATHAGDEVAVPDLAYHPIAIHGGLLHPGEPIPKSVPDLVSLRLRLLMNAPYPALCAALLLAHRMKPDSCQIRLKTGRWAVEHSRRDMGDLLMVLDAFVRHQGQTPCRRTFGGLGPNVFIHSLEAVGIASQVQKRLVLAERFFGRLRSGAEQMEVHTLLRPLAEALDDWLEHTEPIGSGVPT